MIGTTTGTPLDDTAARAGAALDWLRFRVGPPEDPTGWTRCDEVDAAHVAGWEARVATALEAEHGRSHPSTAAAYVLDWCAGLPGHVGGAFFRLARRVPRLDRASLAFACEPVERYPDRVALLDRRFWCLPDDPAAGHPAATAVRDLDALADVLRAQVRAHADEFLAGYRGGARLPRRHLLGAFFDGLDVGVWSAGSPSGAPPLLGDAAAALPGDARFPRTALRAVVDTGGREHVSRCRISCCQHYRVSEGARACVTCPRTGDAERARRLAEV